MVSCSLVFGGIVLFFNTHSHVDTNAQFVTDRDAVITRAGELGVSRLMVIGYKADAIPVSLRFAERHQWVWAAVGIHPTEALEWGEDVERLVREAAAHPKVKAIGEIGLDYYWKDRAPFPIQRDRFRQQIRLARELKKPIVIHDRDAHEDVIGILEEEHACDVGGIMHCFAGDWELAQRALALGFYLGVGGTITYRNNSVGQDVVRRAPLNRLVLETDDPYLAPVPFRGKRNEPGYVKHVAEFVALLRGLSIEEIAAVTTQNGMSVLGFDIEQNFS